MKKKKNTETGELKEEVVSSILEHTTPNRSRWKKKLKSNWEA